MGGMTGRIGATEEERRTRQGSEEGESMCGATPTVGHYGQTNYFPTPAEKYAERLHCWRGTAPAGAPRLRYTGPPYWVLGVASPAGEELLIAEQPRVELWGGVVGVMQLQATDTCLQCV